MTGAPGPSAVSGPGGLLGTKIVPPTIPGGFLRRPRLEDRLDLGVTGPVTLVSAGAGPGKTLVVASWARITAAERAAEGPTVAWLALDRDDNEPTLFWSAVAAALRVSGAVRADNPLTELALEQGLTAQGMRTLRMGLNDLSPGSVLVLDDFHVIDNLEILESVAVLLRHESPLRLVLVSRADPVLPLHRLRVSGGLREIRATDLAFDQEEADGFLRLNGHTLPRTDVAGLVERTEGWAAGLRLAAMFLSRDSAPGRAGEFAGDDRAVSEYLLGEVIGSQPAHTRDFLLRTCISDRTCGPLADVLVDGGHGQRRLEELERANTFITSVGPHRHWYRYHPLLRETLLHELRTGDPALHRELHRHAARWFAVHDAPVQALRHAADAQDWVLLGELFVTTAAARILSADRQAMNEALARIPDAELTRTAALATCAAAKLEYAGRFAEIPAVVARAQRMLAVDNSSYRAATAAVVGLWVTAIARPTGDMQLQLRTCAAVLTRLAEVKEPFPAADQYRAVALANQGVGLLWTGQVEAARPVLCAALDAAAAADMEYTKLGCLGELGLAAVVVGRLHEAEMWASQGVDLAGQRGWTSLTNAAGNYLAAAMVLLLRGRPADAEPLLRHGAAASKEPLLSIAIMIGQAMVAAALGRPQSALRSAGAARDTIARLADPPPFLLRWVGVAEAEADLSAANPAAVTARLNSQTIPEYAGEWSEQETVRASRALMELGALPEADRVLRQATTDSENPLTGVEVWLAAALVADRLRQDDRAVQAMGRAVRRATPERVCLPFLTFDRARCARLLSRVIAHDPPEKAFILELTRLTSQGGQPETEPEPLAEPLTDREMGVLRLLPSMLSNTEIADELFISVNTVKVHLKSLYRKLDVANRRGAVRRGYSLRLIS
ncbi:MAG TPA: LuxR C-terminal-related transcriptional regulator [Nakamurella sp.]|nr:LuxR C-terminal-related transcriptional regulator [Nakamurella sp.]